MEVFSQVAIEWTGVVGWWAHHGYSCANMDVVKL